MRTILLYILLAISLSCAQSWITGKSPGTTLLGRFDTLWVKESGSYTDVRSIIGSDVSALYDDMDSTIAAFEGNKYAHWALFYPDIDFTDDLTDMTGWMRLRDSIEAGVYSYRCYLGGGKLVVDSMYACIYTTGPTAGSIPNVIVTGTIDGINILGGIPATSVYSSGAECENFAYFHGRGGRVVRNIHVWGDFTCGNTLASTFKDLKWNQGVEGFTGTLATVSQETSNTREGAGALRVTQTNLAGYGIDTLANAVKDRAYYMHGSVYKESSQTDTDVIVRVYEDETGTLVGADTVTSDGSWVNFDIDNFSFTSAASTYGMIIRVYPSTSGVDSCIVDSVQITSAGCTPDSTAGKTRLVMFHWFEVTAYVENFLSYFAPNIGITLYNWNDNYINHLRAGRSAGTNIEFISCSSTYIDHIVVHGGPVKVTGSRRVKRNLPRIYISGGNHIGINGLELEATGSDTLIQLEGGSKVHIENCYVGTFPSGLAEGDENKVIVYNDGIHDDIVLTNFTFPNSSVQYELLYSDESSGIYKALGGSYIRLPMNVATRPTATLPFNIGTGNFFYNYFNDTYGVTEPIIGHQDTIMRGYIFDYNQLKNAGGRNVPVMLKRDYVGYWKNTLANVKFEGSDTTFGNYGGASTMADSLEYVKDKLKDLIIKLAGNDSTAFDISY